MKFSDMLLVIAHRQGAETNMLMTFDEYREKVLYYWCQSMDQAARHIERILMQRGNKEAWAKTDHGKEYGYDVRFCHDEQDLKDFLHGHFNDWPEWYLDVDRCSDECLRALEEYNYDRNGVSIGDSFRYEEREHCIERGELLQDFDGTGYRVLECYSRDNFLLINQETGNLFVAAGVKCYERCPYAGETSKENRETGIKWEKAVYLNPVPSRFDFKALKEEYSREKGKGPTERSMEEKMQEAIAKVGDMSVGNLGEKIDRAMEIYHAGDSGEEQRTTRHPTLENRKK